MMTVKQVSLLTGVSVRTLQFYDSIGLFRPAGTTEAGYRLYDGSSLEVLQRIIFFKGLDFTLREIKEIIENPQFDTAAAFEKQKKAVKAKRDRLDLMLQTLDGLIGSGEYMGCEKFDLSGYFNTLYGFKDRYPDKIAGMYGSLEKFDEVVSQLKQNEGKIADMAEKLYGSVEEFTKAMEKNFTNFVSEGFDVSKMNTDQLIERTEAITRRLTEDLDRNPESLAVQEIVGEMVSFVNDCNRGIDMGRKYWDFMAESYMTNHTWIEANDRKYGNGASEFIGRALKAYIESHRPESEYGSDS
ncbi:MerR family transcriptional regulator [Lachnospiraceae bacterium NSJ-143]|nr:MerR family transcriptional regulator [Lachnospiraceae bacterium NSJ-143]